MARGAKILVTGATGTIARPIAEHLARDNEVWCAGRFSDAKAKAELETLGVRTCFWDMGATAAPRLPDDFTHVLHSALHFGPSLEEHDQAIACNAEGAALLMQHCRKAKAFVYVSTFCAYRKRPDHHEHLYAETDALGTSVSFSASYPASKIAAEGAVRSAARMLDLPATIARMNVGYSWAGGSGGLPVSFYQMMAAGRPVPVAPGADERCSPIAAEDIAAQSHALFEIASIPTTIVNWAGDEAVSTRQMCDYIAAVTGLEATFEERPVWFDFFASDNARRERLIGKCGVHWKEGVRQTLERRLGISTRTPLSGPGAPG
jgi:nucleoside-diphosphate-sugar epimerase